MADKKSPRKLINPLLNASVTGATLEDFTQDVTICPAPETLPTLGLERVSLNDSEIEGDPLANNTLNQQSFQLESSHQFCDSINVSPISQPAASTETGTIAETISNSFTSSVVKSFTNILNLKDTPTQKSTETASSVEHLLNASASSANGSNVSSVPLYPTNKESGNYSLGGPPRSLPRKFKHRVPTPGLSAPDITSISAPPAFFPTPKAQSSAHTPESFYQYPDNLSGISSVPLTPLSRTAVSIGSTPGLYIPDSYENKTTAEPLSRILFQTPKHDSSASVENISSFENFATKEEKSYDFTSLENSAFVQRKSFDVLSSCSSIHPGTPLSGFSLIESSASVTPTSRASPNPVDISTPPLIPAAEQGATSNIYRRQGQKKAAYAPIPGFYSTRVQPNFLQPETSQPVGSLSYDPAKSAQFTSNSNNIESLDGSPLTFLEFNLGVTQQTIPTALNPTPNTATGWDNIPSDNMAQSVATPLVPYRPVYYHWFYKKEIEGRIIWQPFSMVDSLALEAAFISADISPESMVATDGGRYDVNILRRQRKAVYWESTPNEVLRCSWFYKASADGRFIPYEENIATKLEEEYKIAYEINQWHRKVDLPNGETVIFQAPDILVLFPQSVSPDTWNNTPQSAVRPRVVKRGMDEFEIDEGEPNRVDHLLFLVHGIGSVCDLKFRSVEKVVDDFRSISQQLVEAHYKSSFTKGLANRIEVLPVSWHNQLHSEDTGIDRKLKSITLESIPRLRDFTNDTLLDILFYTSPIYCQTIISTVGNELNRIYTLFKQRNPGFSGSVSLGGHSLGSLILFDILCHQHPTESDDQNPDGNDRDTVRPLRPPSPSHRRMSRRISYMMGAVGTGQPQLTYPQLNFHPTAFFALGSPIGMFVTVRGLESLGEQFALPTCPGFFNIFHPYDPVAYRVESLINPELGKVRPVLIPHHKGRKRMHLELKETMARVGADIKQRLFDSIKNTWSSVSQLASFHRSDRTLEAEVDKVLQEQMTSEENNGTDCEFEEDFEFTDLPVGILNNGRRIDYVLQEAPFEFFNEYIFALTSHVCYWESEDTMLLILKEIYNSIGISPDTKVPQQTMSIERSSPSLSSEGASASQLASQSTSAGGIIRKT